MRLSAPFFILLLSLNIFDRRDDNKLTKGKKHMTGNIVAASSNIFNVPEMKAVCKANDISINDFVMSALSTTLHQYLDFKDDNQLINILMPANMRYKFYQTREEIKAENKFSSMPLKMPIAAKMKDAYIKVQKVTKKIKQSVGYLYSAYALTFWCTLLGPRQIPRLFLHNAAMGFTMAFSNVPGPIKQF